MFNNKKLDVMIIALEQNLSFEILDAIINNISNWFPNWSDKQNINFNMHVSKIKEEYERQNLLFQTKKYYSGQKQAIIISNQVLDENVVLTVYKDNSNLFLNVLLS